ncbi:WD domain-containing protein [Colletotrichum higginsianum IMI 349063]|uniref:WD domain-containing protein n=3 Tax=Colletotrichum higginsianum TaxID=80884 RepID=A0A1B7Y1R0_COLHI|nr:WD domain-containing protein [Colletotrichum higginsianum IMI 349063]OBR05943.1 WD domain-containing protein [Colletotrichum higginsianum IMI 349063]TIC97399.1 Mitogen-activated protein kinase-binding protein 1 [Colletotrichum higginsianum]
MNATPTNRLKLTPGNSPYLQRPTSRTPLRGRLPHESRLSLKRVIGTTCASPTGFDTVNSSFAYIAGGAVVVVDVDGEHYAQRFYRARPTATPVYGSASLSNNYSAPSTPKANDSRNRVAAGIRESQSWSDSPSSTWTSRERIKAATCLALSRDGRYLAVGETGYAPRVLIFNLEDASSDVPLVSLSEHGFGVRVVAWSSDTRWLASLGTSNDGFLFIWRIDPRTGAAKLYQQNRCTSTIKGMVWMGNSLVTLGVRHIKIWRVEEPQSTSPSKSRFNEANSTPQPPQRLLNGRNVLLGSLLEASFSCAAVVDETNIIICSEAGDVCMVEDDGKQTRLIKCLNVDFPITSITIRHATAYLSGKAGQVATLNVRAVLDSLPDSVLSQSVAPSGLVAMGFLTENLVTIDEKHTVDIWSSSYLPGKNEEDPSHVSIPGHGDQILGIQTLAKPNDQGADFFTWSGSGKVIFWDMKGRIKCSLDVPIEQAIPENEMDPVNQLNVVRATRAGKMLVAADKFGVLRIMDLSTKECLLETKAHSSDCQDITIYEDDNKFLLATCGRDRTVQLFHRSSTGEFRHYQTLEFAARVVQTLIPAEDKIITCSLDRTLQVYDIVCKEDDVDEIAALPSRTNILKAAPTSFALGLDDRTAFVSMLDRSVCQYDLSNGKLLNCFKCVDEGGYETAIMDSLIFSQPSGKDSGVLLGVSNTDKSVRLYDAHSGQFVDREWGHTEAINGVTLTDDDDGSQRVISVGSDGTVMLWGIEGEDAAPSSISRDPSPMKDGSAAARPPLRRVLSKAELAEFQRPSSAQGGRRSPPRTIRRRTSRYGLSNSVSTPKTAMQSSPLAEDTPSRRSSGSQSGSPPISPKSRTSRRPSLPSLGLPPKKSSPNLRGFGSLNMATEQTCRSLRAYRKKLSSADPLSEDVIFELEQELRLTAAALGERATRTKAMHDTALLSGLLDQYEERLASMLDEKLRNTFQAREVTTPSEEREEVLLSQRPGTAGGETNSTVSSS